MKVGIFVRPRIVAAAAIALTLGVAPVVSNATPQVEIDLPTVVEPLIDTIPLTNGQEPASTRSTEHVAEVRPDQPFSMAAVRWTGDVPDVVALQARNTEGNWGEWFEVDPVDGLDADAPGVRKASEPAWLGDATALRVRAERDDRPVAPGSLSAVVIDPGKASGDGIAPNAYAMSPAPRVISRRGWGADENMRRRCYRETGWDVDYSTTVKAVTVHHTAGTNSYSAADSARIVRGIYAYHGQTLRWCDIGYNVLVDKYGQIFEGRYGGLNLPIWGAHAGGFNEYTTGVSLMGTYTNVAPRAAQLESAARFIAWKLSRGYRGPNARVTLTSAGGGTSKYPRGTRVSLPRIFTHRDVGSTSCPGNEVYRRMPQLRQRVTTLMGDWRSSPIYQRWRRENADAGRLGGVFAVERPTVPTGRATKFASGRIWAFWSSRTGTHTVQDAIRDKWNRMGRASSRFGFPTTDQRGTPDRRGLYNHFQRGSIYWSPWYGAHSINGYIRAKWRDLQWERGPLGYPQTDVRTVPNGDGYYSFFSHGSIYRHVNGRAHALIRGFHRAWADTGWERGPLGYPVSDEYSTVTGSRQDFQGGYITRNGITGEMTVVTNAR